MSPSPTRTGENVVMRTTIVMRNIPGTSTRLAYVGTVDVLDDYAAGKGAPPLAVRAAKLADDPCRHDREKLNYSLPTGIFVLGLVHFVVFDVTADGGKTRRAIESDPTGMGARLRLLHSPVLGRVEGWPIIRASAQWLTP